MIDLFSPARATLKANSYFAAYNDAAGNFAVFRNSEAPDNSTDFTTIEQATVDEDQNTTWSRQQLIFHNWGRDTDWPTLYARARKQRDIFAARGTFVAVGTDPAVPYQLIGPATISTDRDPVTENVVASIALTFGVVDL